VIASRLVAFTRVMACFRALAEFDCAGLENRRIVAAETGRAGRQDKSRDVRRSRSGYRARLVSALHQRLARCFARSRCAPVCKPLAFLSPPHIAPKP